MIKDKLRELFAEYDAGLQKIIQEVLAVEQENISLERPRVKDKIDEIVTREAKLQVQQEAKGADE